MAQKWIWLDLIALQWDWSVISKWSQSQTSDSNIPAPRCFIASLSHGFHLQTMEFRTNPMEFRANPSRIPIKFRGGQSLMRWRARFGQSIAISWISCFSIVLCLSFRCATICVRATTCITCSLRCQTLQTLCSTEGYFSHNETHLVRYDNRWQSMQITEIIQSIQITRCIQYTKFKVPLGSRTQACTFWTPQPSVLKAPGQSLNLMVPIVLPTCSKIAVYISVIRPGILTEDGG